jgi:hypothetical protein
VQEAVGDVELIEPPTFRQLHLPVEAHLHLTGAGGHGESLHARELHGQAYAVTSAELQAIASDM